MNSEQILLTVKLYASLAAAGLSAALRASFTWLATGCDTLHTYFISKSAHYRR